MPCCEIVGMRCYIWRMRSTSKDSRGRPLRLLEAMKAQGRYPNYLSIAADMWPDDGAADSTKVSRLSNYASGRISIGTRDLVRLSEILSCSTDFLLGASRDPKKSWLDAPV